MRIMFISNLYPPNAIGGYERLCFDIASALVERGHQISVLTSRYGGKGEDYSGQRINRSLGLFAVEGNIYQPFECSPEERERIKVWNIKILEEYVEQEQPDLVFVWNLYFLDPSLLSAIQQLHKEVVYLLTDNWLIAFLNSAFIRQYYAEQVFGNIPWLRRACAALVNRASSFRRSSFDMQGRAIFASKFMQRLYAKAGFSFNDSTTIYHGVAFPTGGHATTRYELVTSGELSLLFAGRLVDIKGVHTAIEALPHIIKALPDFRVKLTVVGDAQDQRYLERLYGMIRDLCLEDRVIFAPSVREEELFGLFQTHDIYLFPSLYEPFSLTLIHALAGGIPTVASDVGGNPEIVRERDTGLLFRKEDAGALARAVIALVRDSELRETIASNARCTARKYTFERMVAEVETYLERKS